MKIVTRQEFLKYPIGTIYREYEPCIARAIMVKDETYPSEGDYPGDFYTYELGWASIDTIGLCEPDAMGGSFEQGTMCHRYGLYDKEALFIVFEKEDLEFLIKVSKEAIDALKAR